TELDHTLLVPKTGFFIILQYCCIAQICALSQLFFQVAHQYMRITHTQVKPLTSNWMNGVSCIAHQDHPPHGLLFSEHLRKRETETLAGFLEFSGTIAISVLQGIQKMLVIFFT